MHYGPLLSILGEFEYTYVEQLEDDTIVPKTSKRTSKKDLLKADITLIEYPGKRGRDGETERGRGESFDWVMVVILSYPTHTHSQVAFLWDVMHMLSCISFHIIYQVNSTDWLQSHKTGSDVIRMLRSDWSLVT